MKCVRFLRILLGITFLVAACFMMMQMGQVRAWLILHAPWLAGWLALAWVLPLLIGYLGFDLLLGRRPLPSSVVASVILAASLLYFIRVFWIVGDSSASDLWPVRTLHPAIVIGANAACLLGALIVLAGLRAFGRNPKAASPGTSWKAKD